MIKNFINDDIILSKKREGVFVSEKEIIDLIIKTGNKYIDEDTIDSIIYQINNIDYLKIDLDISFDTENLQFNQEELFGSSIEGDPLLGYQILDNGFSFLGVQAGGDWEYPIFFILYSDGKKLRAYTPLYGNPLNLDFKTAFGSENEVEDNALLKKNLEEYKSKGYLPIDFDEEDIWTKDFTKIYCQKYGILEAENDENFGFNWNAIKEDIKTTIQLI